MYVFCFYDFFNAVPPSVSVLSYRTVIEGDNLFLACNANGSPSPSIEWTKVNGSEVLSNTPVLTLFNVIRPGNPSETAQYECTARNGYGEPASAVVTVQVCCEYTQFYLRCYLNETYSNMVGFCVDLSTVYMYCWKLTHKNNSFLDNH